MSAFRIPKLRDEFLIYAAMLLVVESVYGGCLVASPELRAPARLVPFTGIMVVHALLYLIVPRLSPRRIWLPIYFVLQGLLAFGLIDMAHTAGTTVSLYLYLALAAQAIGLLSNRPRLAAGVVLAYLLAGMLTFAWFWGWAEFPPFLVLAGPQTLFILAFAVLFFRQAYERRRAQALLSELEIAHRELETAHRQLGEYANRVEDLTLTNERQRLARELHDTLAQGVAGLILQLEAIDKQLTHGRLERAQVIVTQAMARARATLADARRAIDDLRSGHLQVGDLCEAVRGEAERFTNATGISCTVDATGAQDIRLPDQLHGHVLRVVAEGLTNSARHARAGQVWVNLAVTDATLAVSVRDDGAGFDSEAVNGRSGHYGLIGMRERARLAGGSLEVTSAPGQGTTVTLRLPIVQTNVESSHA